MKRATNGIGQLLVIIEVDWVDLDGSWPEDLTGEFVGENWLSRVKLQLGIEKFRNGKAIGIVLRHDGYLGSHKVKEEDRGLPMTRSL